MICPKDCPRLAHFSAWLAELIAPVMLGAKPAEILSFQKKASTYFKDIEALESCRRNCTRLVIEHLECANDTTKYFIYDRSELDKWLSDPRHIRFLVSQGYPETYDLEAYLAEIFKRLMALDDFPHEIGIFLGYPLKDILGFMGLANLKLTSISKWRVYGDPRISLEKMHRIDQARSNVAHMLKQQPPEFVFQKLA